MSLLRSTCPPFSTTPGFPTLLLRADLVRIDQTESKLLDHIANFMEVCMCCALLLDD